jgi:competence protein ComEC
MPRLRLSRMDEHDRVKSRAGTWPQEHRERRTLPWWGPGSAYVHACAEAIRDAALSEVAAGRLLPWIPVAFGFGIVLYFTADHEPSLYAALALSFVTATLAFALRRRTLGFPLAFGIAAMCMGFATVTLHTATIDHPVLAATSANVALTGWVEKREERARSDRIVVRVAHIEGRTLKQTLERVRVSVRRGLAPPVGAFVSFKARLSPPLQPLRPGGYDFSRDIFFQHIGASGFVLGAITAVPPPADGGWKLRYATTIENIRNAIDARIRTALKGDAASIASALLTGKQDAISQPVYDALFISSLGHILSISGYHMAVVAGIVFFFLRALLALIPALAVRYPIKKFAALGALVAAFLYLLLSGVEVVATQRSFIMIAVVLLGVLVDRPALTMRTLALAAIAVLAFTPEAVVHPSFQSGYAPSS